MDRQDWVKVALVLVLAVTGGERAAAEADPAIPSEGFRVGIGLGGNGFTAGELNRALGAGPAAEVRLGYGVTEGIGVDAAMWGAAMTGRAPGDSPASARRTVGLMGGRLGPTLAFEISDRSAVELGVGLDMAMIGTPYRHMDTTVAYDQGYSHHPQLVGWGGDVRIGYLRSVRPKTDVGVSLAYTYVPYPAAEAGGPDRLVDGSAVTVLFTLLLHSREVGMPMMMPMGGGHSEGRGGGE